jgi:hypothetical protein
MFSSSIPPILHRYIDAGLRPNRGMVLVDWAHADFPIARLQRSEREATFELMGHGRLIAVDK